MHLSSYVCISLKKKKKKKKTGQATTRSVVDRFYCTFDIFSILSSWVFILVVAVVVLLHLLRFALFWFFSLSIISQSIYNNISHQSDSMHSEKHKNKRRKKKKRIWLLDSRGFLGLFTVHSTGPRLYILKAFKKNQYTVHLFCRWPCVWYNVMLRNVSVYKTTLIPADSFWLHSLNIWSIPIYISRMCGCLIDV